jgi:hypothetical protein
MQPKFHAWAMQHVLHALTTSHSTLCLGEHLPPSFRHTDKHTFQPLQPINTCSPIIIVRTPQGDVADPELRGIVPRAVEALGEGIAADDSGAEYEVHRPRGESHMIDIVTPTTGVTCRLPGAAEPAVV